MTLVVGSRKIQSPYLTKKAFVIIAIANPKPGYSVITYNNDPTITTIYPHRPNIFFAINALLLVDCDRLLIVNEFIINFSAGIK